MQRQYNPYNKTYQLICLQNTIAHANNKSNVHSTGQSNISLNASKQKIQFTRSPLRSLQSYQGNLDDSFRHSVQARSKSLSYCFLTPYRKLHMNQSFNNKIQSHRKQENQRFANKLLSASCYVISQNKLEKGYALQKSYKKNIQNYDQIGQRKYLLSPFENTSIGSAVKSMNSSKVQLCTVSKNKQFSCSSYRDHYIQTYLLKNQKLHEGPKRKVIRLT